VITKTDPDGNWLWAKRAGGTGSDTGYGIATDTIGNCYATGFFSSTAGLAAQPLPAVALMKYLTPNWILTATGSGQRGRRIELDIGYAIASDSNGNCYVTGSIRRHRNFWHFIDQPQRWQ
jgi:hypothetical protein